MNKLLLLLLLSCATNNTNIDYFFSSQEFSKSECPPKSTCTIDSWEDVTVIKFLLDGNEGNLTFIKDKLKTLTLLRPTSVLDGVEWESQIRRKMEGSLHPLTNVVKGKDFTKKENILVSGDKKTSVELNAQGEFQMVHISK
jgi:hypothetical protein